MRLQNREHGRPSCTVPVIARASGKISLKGAQCVSRICFAGDSLELQPGQKFSATEYDRIKEHLWKGNVVSADEQPEYNEIHFRATKWKVYKTQCKTRKPLNMQRSTKYAFEAFILKRRDSGDYTVLAYAISTPFELASTRELSKQLHALKSSSGSGNDSGPDAGSSLSKKRSLSTDRCFGEQAEAKKLRQA